MKHRNSPTNRSVETCGSFSKLRIKSHRPRVINPIGRMYFPHPIILPRVLTHQLVIMPVLDVNKLISVSKPITVMMPVLDVNKLISVSKPITVMIIPKISS